MLLGEVVLSGNDIVPHYKFLLCLLVCLVVFQCVCEDHLSFFYRDVRIKVCDV